MDSWLKWFFWTTRICKHEPGLYRMRDLGLGKVMRCKKCGKVLDLI